MRYPGETDTNATSVVTGCFNTHQMILDVWEALGYGDVHSISQPLDSNRALSTFPLDTFSGRCVDPLMGHFLAFRGRCIKCASCLGHHVSSRRNGFPHSLAVLSPFPDVHVDSIQPLRHP